MNDDELADVLGRQYAALILMLRNAVRGCPDDLWGRRDDEAPFWQQAMHAIVATHLYLLHPPYGAGMAALRAKLERDLGAAAADPSLRDLDWVRRANDALTGRTHRPAATPSKQVLLAYLDDLSSACQAMLARPGALGEPNAMTWSGPTTADRLVYNIRHAQHHLGRLHSILGRRGISVPWVMGAETSSQP